MSAKKEKKKKKKNQKEKEKEKKTIYQERLYIGKGKIGGLGGIVRGERGKEGDSKHQHALGTRIRTPEERWRSYRHALGTHTDA